MTRQPEVFAAGLRGLVVPIASLERWPGNYRRGDAEAVAASLRRFGQMKPTHQNVLVFCKGDPKRAAAACGVVSVAMPENQREE